MNLLRSALSAALCAVLACLATPAWSLNLYSNAITLTDDAGRSIQLPKWVGKPAIVTMEYSECRFICSATLRRLQEMQAAADRQGKEYEFLVVSLDPKNDTPAAWTQYRRMRGLDRPNWHFLTASVAETPAIARLLGVHYWLYDEHIMHDFRLLRTDTRGDVVKVMDRFDGDAEEFVR